MMLFHKKYSSLYTHKVPAGCSDWSSLTRQKIFTRHAMVGRNTQLHATLMKRVVRDSYAW